jgi:hypothetical protein
MSYVRAAKELPNLNDAQIKEQSRAYGFAQSDDAHFAESEKAGHNVTVA